MYKFIFAAAKLWKRFRVVFIVQYQIFIKPEYRTLGCYHVSINNFERRNWIYTFKGNKLILIITLKVK